MIVEITDIFTSMQFLCESAAGDGPAREILDAIAWLDPVWFATDTDNAFNNEDEEALIQWAALKMRDCFPDLYAEIVLWNADGMSYDEMSRAITLGIEKRTGLDLGYGYELEGIRAGIPLNSFAFDADPYHESTPSNPAATAFATWLDDSKATQTLKDSLKKCKEPVYQELLALIEWIQNGTGNTMADYTMEEIWEGGWDLPDWEPDQVKYVVEMMDEAEEIFHAAHEMLKRLTSDQYLRNQVIRNLWSIKHHEAEFNELFWGYCPGNRRSADPAGSADVLPSWTDVEKAYKGRRNDRVSHLPRRISYATRKSANLLLRASRSKHALDRTARSKTQGHLLLPTTNHRVVARGLRKSNTAAVARAGYDSRYHQRRASIVQPSRRQRASRIGGLGVIRSSPAQHSFKRWDLLGDRSRAA